ncbi:MAG: PD40 domain-containing protein [Ardenticatenales bacterium]|nr:PD40 domain-containing protein [Ardenticatenales bacterium]
MMKNYAASLAICLFGSLLLFLVLRPGTGAASAEGVLIERISLGPGNTQGNDHANYAAISADGRYIAYNAIASNLVLSDTNNVQDVFLYDRQSGTTRRISVASDGTQGNAQSGDFEPPALSDDGRYIAFVSAASNLVPGDTNNVQDVFVHDQQTGQTVRVSITAGGEQNPWFSWNIAISGDGRYVAFGTNGSLVAGDTGQFDIYVHDRDSDADGIFDEPGAISNSLVSIASDGTKANFGANPSDIAISPDGRHITFASAASNLVPDDTNGEIDTFVHDRDTDEDGIFDEPGAIHTARVSVATDGTQGNGPSIDSDISGDGRYVTFWTEASTLVPNDLPACQIDNCYDVLVHDRDSDDDGVYDEPGATAIWKVSVASDGTPGNGDSYVPAISRDGSVIAFYSFAQNLVAGDSGQLDIFVHELATGTTSRVSVTQQGGQANDFSFLPAISADGQLIAFQSDARNLVPGDSNFRSDIFVYNRSAVGLTPTPSPSPTGTPSPTPSPTPTLPPTPPPPDYWLHLPLVVVPPAD